MSTVAPEPGAATPARPQRAPAGANSVRFTEEMKGCVTFGETDFDRGDNTAREGSTPLKFHLTIEAADMEAFLRDPRREAPAWGWVECDALGGKLEVERGVFNLFVDDGPGTKRMLYRLLFRDGVGHPLTLTGFKVVRNDPGFDVWRDTTTLYTRVLRGHVTDADGDAASDVVASGIIRITMPMFARQLTTFRAGGPTAGRKIANLVAFGRLFLGQLVEVYVRRVVRS